MKKTYISVLYSLVIIFITSLCVYYTQTSYAPLTVNRSPRVSQVETPVLDPIYPLNNKGWSNYKLTVDLDNLPENVQKRVEQNAKVLNYPVRFKNKAKAVHVRIVDTPAGTHALTDTNGEIIKISPQYINETKNNPDQLAKTLTHEIGHALGLLHTYNPTIMYPYNDGTQPLVLDQAQKDYLKHLHHTTFLTVWAAHVLNQRWDAQSINKFSISSHLGRNNLNLYTSDQFTDKNLITTYILIFNVLPIWVMSLILFEAMWFTLNFASKPENP